MSGLLITSAFAAKEGWNWRQVRTDDTSKQIKLLKDENEMIIAKEGVEGMEYNMTTVK